MTTEVEAPEVDQETPDNKYTTRDLVAHAINGEPVEFGQVFDQLMKDRLEVAVADKSVDIASSMFNSPEDEDNQE